MVQGSKNSFGRQQYLISAFEASMWPNSADLNPQFLAAIDNLPADHEEEDRR
jgi:hypothetical protein